MKDLINKIKNINLNNSGLKSFGLGCLVGLLLFFVFQRKEIEYVDVPVRVEVPVPVIEKEFDTIYAPAEIIKGDTEIDSAYYEKYLKLKDSIVKDSLYKDAITIREYKTSVEDDTIRIEVYSKVRGTLLENQTSYETKPYTIPLDTTLRIPLPKKPHFYIGGGIVSPVSPVINAKPSVNAGFMFVEKSSKRAYQLTYDPVNQTVGGSIYFRL